MHSENFIYANSFILYRVYKNEKTGVPRNFSWEIIVSELRRQCCFVEKRRRKILRRTFSRVYWIRNALGIYLALAIQQFAKVDGCFLFKNEKNAVAARRWQWHSILIESDSIVFWLLLLTVNLETSPRAPRPRLFANPSFRPKDYNGSIICANASVLRLNVRSYGRRERRGANRWIFARYV